MPLPRSLACNCSLGPLLSSCVREVRGCNPLGQCNKLLRAQPLCTRAHSQQAEGSEQSSLWIHAYALEHGHWMISLRMCWNVLCCALLNEASTTTNHL